MFTFLFCISNVYSGQQISRSKNAHEKCERRTMNVRVKFISEGCTSFTFVAFPVVRHLHIACKHKWHISLDIIFFLIAAP